MSGRARGRTGGSPLSLTRGVRVRSLRSGPSESCPEHSERGIGWRARGASESEVGAGRATGK